MNQVEIIGRLTKEPELRRTQSGKAVVNFKLAVNRDKDHADFISCIAWGALAETLAKYGFKGMLCGLLGHLRMDDYEKQGVRVNTLSVEAYSIDFLSRKPAENKAPSFEDISAEDTDLPF